MARTQEGRGATRGLGGRGNSDGLRSTFRDTGAVRPRTLAEAAKVHRAADTVRDKAERHYEKHRDIWVARHYATLLLKAAPTLSLNPPGMRSDPKIALMNRARNKVQRNHAKRLHSIEAARKALLDTGRMRHSRPIGWGGKNAAPSKAIERGAQGDAQPKTVAARSATRTDKARVAVAQDRARRKAEAHLVKHPDQWTSKRYRALTEKFDLSKGKHSATDAQQVRDVAMEAANRSVTAKHEARLQRIDAVCERMRESGTIRASRPMGRYIGLGV